MVNLSKFRSNKKNIKWNYRVNKKLTHNMSTWTSVTIKFIVVSQPKKKPKLCT